MGVADEEVIDNMAFVFFESVLDELGHKLHYDAIVNYAGNGFFEKSWDLISEHNPFNIKADRKQGASSGGLSGFFRKSSIHIAGG